VKAQVGSESSQPTVSTGTRAVVVVVAGEVLEVAVLDEVVAAVVVVIPSIPVEPEHPAATTAVRTKARERRRPGMGSA
jgi:hypothetical protein